MRFKVFSNLSDATHRFFCVSLKKHGPTIAFKTISACLILNLPRKECPMSMDFMGGICTEMV